MDQARLQDAVRTALQAENVTLDDAALGRVTSAVVAGFNAATEDPAATGPAADAPAALAGASPDPNQSQADDPTIDNPT